jgi:hypothetical protein
MRSHSTSPVAIRPERGRHWAGPPGATCIREYHLARLSRLIGIHPRRGAQEENLARMFHELMSRDREDGRATGQPQGVGSEAYLNGKSQGPTPKDARKDGQIRGRSKRFMKYPG